MNDYQLLHGTGVAIITPFAKDLSVDYNALGKLIDLIISGGVNYIVTLGTTGETPVLSKDEKKAIISFTCRQVAGRVPVIVGIGGNDTAALLSDLKDLPLEHAAAILSASPNYNKPSAEGIRLHYEALADASPRPIVLYNVPGRTGKNMDAHTTLKLAEHKNIIGIKEASADLPQCMEILRNSPEDFVVVSGDDALALPQIACGMKGLISVAANSFPKKISDMVSCSLKEDFKTAVKINNDLMDAYQVMFAENNPAGVKAFLYEMGIIENVLRLPLVPLSASYHHQVSNYLKK